MRKAVVIGAGISGLFTAYHLARNNFNVTVLEARDTVGGRMRTAQGIDTGAWRVPSSHERMMLLSKCLNIDLVPTYSSALSAGIKKKTIKPRAGHSLMDEHIFKSRKVSDALSQELGTGYMGTFAGQQRTYDASTASDYFVPRIGGMQEYCNQLANLFKDIGNGTIIVQAQVKFIEKIKKGYLLHYVKRSGNKFETRAIRCSKLVLACQPTNFPQTDFEKHLAPVKAATGTVPLCHVYVRVSRKIEPMHIITDDRLGQIIAVGPKLLMIYAGGRLAQYHNNRWTHCRKQYKKELQTLLRKHIRNSVEKIVKVSYWQNAVSYWNSNTAGKPLLNECVIPHPKALPGLVCTGEGFSLVQGWAEGALQTAEIALDYLLLKKIPFKMLPRVPKNCLAYDGRVIDVTDWMSKHPGGRKAIQNHLTDKEIEPIFSMIHGHAPYALAHLLSMQIGFLQ